MLNESFRTLHYATDDKLKIIIKSFASLFLHIFPRKCDMYILINVHCYLFIYYTSYNRCIVKRVRVKFIRRYINYLVRGTAHHTFGELLSFSSTWKTWSESLCPLLVWITWIRFRLMYIWWQWYSMMAIICSILANQVEICRKKRNYRVKEIHTYLCVFVCMHNAHCNGTRKSTLLWTLQLKSI